MKTEYLKENKLINYNMFKDKILLVNLAPKAIILASLCCLDNLVDLVL